MITINFDTLYEKGDVVLFKYKGLILAGIVTGYYVDTSAGNSIWYNITASKTKTFNYANDSDIAEHDILCKLEGEKSVEAVTHFVKNEQ